MKQQILPEIDLSTLDDKTRDELLTRLYRTECRCWLMWMLIGCVCLLFVNSIFKALPWWGDILLGSAVVVYSAALAFWIAFPVQPILCVLRQLGGKERQAKIEQSFDGTWQSVKDFLFPVVAVVCAIVAWMLKIHFAA